jgi:hypothetical protein
VLDVDGVDGAISVLQGVNKFRSTEVFLAIFSDLLSRLDNPFHPVSLGIISRSP